MCCRSQAVADNLPALQDLRLDFSVVTISVASLTALLPRPRPAFRRLVLSARCAFIAAAVHLVLQRCPTLEELWLGFYGLGGRLVSAPPLLQPAYSEGLRRC